MHDPPAPDPRVTPLAPVCSNCGASDFVWANDLKTGGLGGGSLSLRSRGELSLGTRICRACGHADLFLKDPSILRMPHTWKPGEFTPITPRPAAHHAAAAPYVTAPPPAPVAPAAPPPPPAPPSEPPPPPPLASPPPPPPEALPSEPAPEAAPPAEGPSAPTEATPASPPEATPAEGGKKATRRRAKSKS